MVNIPTLVAPSSRTWLGVAREASTGTATLPTNTIPLDKSQYEVEDMPHYLEDLAIRGSMSHRFADVLGVDDASFSFGGPMYGDVWGYFLDNVFGDLSTTGTSPANGTTLALAAAQAGTAVTVHSASGYSSASTVQIDSGSIAEVVVLTNVTGTVLTFGNNPLRFAHNNAATVTTVTGPYTHTFAVLNQSGGVSGVAGAQPPTHSLTDWTSLTANVQARTYPAACVGSLDITGNSEGLLMGKVSGNTWLSVPASTIPTNTTTFTAPLPAWRTTLSVGGTAVNYSGEYSIAIKRELGVYWTAENQQTPYIIARGDLDATGANKYTVPSNEDPLQWMLTSNQQQLQIVVNNGLSGTSQLQYTFNMTFMDIIKTKPVRSGVLVGYDAEYRTRANTTDVGGSGGLGQMTVQLINNIATY